MYPLEDHAARHLRDAADTRHAAMKSALSRPISVPAGFLDPIQTIGKARAQMAADRARANVIPFRKAAPSPPPSPPPAVPLRPAALNRVGKLSQAPDRKHRPTPLDPAQRRDLADLLRTKLLQAASR